MPSGAGVAKTGFEPRIAVAQPFCSKVVIAKHPDLCFRPLFKTFLGSGRVEGVRSAPYHDSIIGLISRERHLMAASLPHPMAASLPLNLVKASLSPARESITS
eukprot:1158113-Pelagomonas_calceolata.AAC.1